MHGAGIPARRQPVNHSLVPTLNARLETARPHPADAIGFLRVEFKELHDRLVWQDCIDSRRPGKRAIRYLQRLVYVSAQGLKSGRW